MLKSGQQGRISRHTAAGAIQEDILSPRISTIDLSFWVNQALPPSDRPHSGPGFKLDHGVDGQVGSIHRIIIQPQVGLLNQPFLPLSTLFSTTATAESAVPVNAPITTAAVEDIASSSSLGPRGNMSVHHV